MRNKETESRLEMAKRHALFAATFLGEHGDLTVDAIVSEAKKIQFEEDYPFVGKEFDGIYGMIQSLSDKYFDMEERVNELEKQLSEKK